MEDTSNLTEFDDHQSNSKYDSQPDARASEYQDHQSSNDISFLSVDISDNHKYQKPKRKSLFAPTASQISAQREMERRRNTIDPNDDPFWEKRGGKSEHLFTKDRHKVEQSELSPPNPHKNLDVSPLPSSSHLLTETKASKCGIYRPPNANAKEVGPPIAPIPLSSHLLTPTKASRLYEYKSPPKEIDASAILLRPRSRSPEPVKLPESLLHAMRPTQACISATYVRKDNAQYRDPREIGWKSKTRLSNDLHKSISEIVGMNDNRIEETSPTANKEDSKFKNVQSKLHTPTVASSHSKYKSPQQLEIEQEDEILTELAALNTDEDGNEKRASYSGAYGTYSNVTSKLYEPTTAVLAGAWNRDPEFDFVEPINLDQIMPTRLSSLSPTVQSRLMESTSAYESSRREKHHQVDAADVGSVEKAAQRRKSIDAVHKPGHISYSQQNSRAATPILSRSGSPAHFKSMDAADDHSPNKQIVATISGTGKKLFTTLSFDKREDTDTILDGGPNESSITDNA